MSAEPAHTAADVLSAAAREERPVAATPVEAADLADKYDQMLHLADLFDGAGEQMRSMARLGVEVLGDPAVAESAPLSPHTYAEAAAEIRAATTGKNGLIGRSIELDADALVLRATVLTYRWIDELQTAAAQTLGSIAARAIGYLAPEVELGGAIVAAGLIETDTLDRDGVAAYLSELAEAHPDLMAHVTTGGGLLDNLQMRTLLTAGTLTGDPGRQARAGGLRAAGVQPLELGFEAALRDAAVGVTVRGPAAVPSTARADVVPRSLGDLMSALASTTEPVRVRRVGPGRYVALLPGPYGSPMPGRLRLVSGAPGDYVGTTVAAIRAAVAADAADRGAADGGGPAHVLLVGSGAGGAAAVDIAATDDLGFVVDQVVTAGAPSAQVPRLPASVRVLSLEDRSDPVALLGSLINAGRPNRLTVVYDTHAGDTPAGTNAYVVGGLAADRSDHPALVAELRRLRKLGYLAG